MKASELIQKLREQIELHGDYEVYVESYNCDFSYPVNDVHDGYIHEKSGAVKYVTYII